MIYGCGLDRRDPLYGVLKDELGERGHWRDRPRGDPAKGYRMKGSKEAGK